MYTVCIFLIPETIYASPAAKETSEEVYQETKNMLNVKANKKMIQQHVYQQSGKVVTLKDLHNIASDANKVNVENYDLHSEFLCGS